MAEEITAAMKQWSLDDLVEKAGTAQTKTEKALNWGRPGYLTKSELDVYVQFRDEVEKRGGEFKNTVYSFTEVEGEVYTLSRWLRARKYVLADTIKMVEEATEERAVPRAVDYYPDAEAALGVDPSIFISQYPQLYSGFSKDGCPVFYSKPGILNIDGIECMTTIHGILKFHWHVMQHDYKKRLLQFKKENPSFTRFECVSILDLSGLAASNLNSRTLDIIKKQAFIDSLCFPETMNKMLVVNAPRFFSATWGIIKGFVDARTAAKIEVVSSSSAAQKKLKEIIDVNQIPSDYGGTAESTDVTLAKEAAVNADKGGRSRLKTEVMYVRSYLSWKFQMKEDEEADIWVYTRAKTGATFTISDASTKKPLAPPVLIKHNVSKDDDNTKPSNGQITTQRISGVSEVKVKAENLKSRMSSESYLVVVNIFKK